MKSEYPFKKTVLPNKLTVLFYKMPSVKSTYAISYIKVGSSFESPEERGITHFTEHMAFLKTKRFKNNLEITQFAQLNGMNYGATTYNSKTEYWSVFPYNNYKKGIELLNELIFNPVITKKEVEKEKGVALSEFNDFWHNPDRRFNHMTLVKRFEKENHPYSYRPLGIPETIKSISKSDVVNWRKKYYTPSNMILSFAGNIDEDKILQETKRVFGPIDKGKKHEDPKFKPNYSGFTLFHQEDKRPQIRFVLSFPTFGSGNSKKEKRVRLNLLRYIFGGSSASRLNQELRENKRYVYSIGASANFFKWMGEIYISGAVPNEKLVESLKIVKDQIEILKEKGVTKKEIKFSNSYLNAYTLMQFDSPSSIANYFIDQLFYSDELWFPEDYIKTANKITKAQLNKIAKEVFDFSKVNISLLGDINKNQIEEIKKVYKGN